MKKDKTVLPKPKKGYRWVINVTTEGYAAAQIPNKISTHRADGQFFEEVTSDNLDSLAYHFDHSAIEESFGEHFKHKIIPR